MALQRNILMLMFTFFKHGNELFAQINTNHIIIHLNKIVHYFISPLFVGTAIPLVCCVQPAASSSTVSIINITEDLGNWKFPFGSIPVMVIPFTSPTPCAVACTSLGLYSVMLLKSSAINLPMISAPLLLITSV